MKYTFKKEEKLKSRKLIGQLFIDGKRLTSFPIQMVYLQIDHTSTGLYQASFSVSKRLFKKAVDRNRIKRLMRESYRLQKQALTDEKYTKKYIFMFIYLSNEKLSYPNIAIQMNRLLEKFLNKIDQ